jgi:hypothetical protein
VPPSDPHGALPWPRDTGAEGDGERSVAIPGPRRDRPIPPAVPHDLWAAKPADEKRRFVDPDVGALSTDVFNWAAGFTRVLPLRTLADHNCLCHSVAIALWGLQDHGYVLRTAIAQSMAGPGPFPRFLQEQYNKAQVERDVLDFGKEIERSPEEWDREWARELALARDTNQSLTEIHVFVVAHLLRRVILVLS